MDSLFKYLFFASAFLIIASGCATKNSTLVRVNNFAVVDGNTSEQVFLACHNKRPATSKDIYQLAKYYPPGIHKIILKATQTIKEKGVVNEAYLTVDVDFKQGHEYSLHGVFEKNIVNVIIMDKSSGMAEKLQSIPLKPSYKSSYNQTFKLCQISTI
jgi:hypothetical protein